MVSVSLVHRSQNHLLIRVSVNHQLARKMRSIPLKVSAKPATSWFQTQISRHVLNPYVMLGAKSLCKENVVHAMLIKSSLMNSLVQDQNAVNRRKLQLLVNVKYVPTSWSAHLISFHVRSHHVMLDKLYLQLVSVRHVLMVFNLMMIRLLVSSNLKISMQTPCK